MGRPKVVAPFLSKDQEFQVRPAADARVAAARAGFDVHAPAEERPLAIVKEYPHLAISALTSDQLAMGRIQGRQFQILLPKGGNVLYLQGPPASVVVPPLSFPRVEQLGARVRSS